MEPSVCYNCGNESGPHQHLLARAAKEAQRMKPPIITSTAATRIF